EVQTRGPTADTYDIHALSSYAAPADCGPTQQFIDELFIYEVLYVAARPLSTSFGGAVWSPATPVAMPASMSGLSRSSPALHSRVLLAVPGGGRDAAFAQLELLHLAVLGSRQLVNDV